MKIYHFGDRALMFTSKRRRKRFGYRNTAIGRHWDIGSLRFVLLHN